MTSFRNPNCKLCSLHKGATTVCVGGDGPRDASILIVGEAPGKTEDEVGLPFQGRAGNLLNEILLENGINRSDVRIRNVVNCRPPKNRRPTEEEIQACASNYLIQEFLNIKPELILLLGNTALHALTTREDGILNNRGLIPFPEHLFHIAENEKTSTVFATVHPASALYSSRMKEVLKEDIEKFTLLV